MRSFGALNRVLCACEDEFAELCEARPQMLIVLEHESDYLQYMLTVALSQLLQRVLNHKLAIVLGILLVEACDVVHQRKLHHDEPTAKYIRLENVVLSVPSVASLLYVRLPQQRTQVLRCAPNGCHRACAPIITLLIVVL